MSKRSLKRKTIVKEVEKPKWMKYIRLIEKTHLDVIPPKINL